MFTFQTLLSIVSSLVLFSSPRRRIESENFRYNFMGLISAASRNLGAPIRLRAAGY